LRWRRDCHGIVKYGRCASIIHFERFGMAVKVAMVTGAGGAIGRAIARTLAGRGYQIVLVGRNRASLEETGALLGGAGVVAPGDVTRVSDVQQIVDQTLKTFGRIDAVVNNAGLAPVKTIEQTSPEDWRAVIDTNVSAAYYFARAVWPTFKQQGGGVVVNISSRSARDPFPGFLAYGAAKAALNTFGLSLAREGAAIGVRVHTVGLGAVETPMLRNILSTEQLSTDNTLSPQDVADVVGGCIDGSLKFTSGEVIWLSKTV
jgi:3-oxoacyl-[acyl-carrier protein] reductase